jgi:hypothetical protein
MKTTGMYTPSMARGTGITIESVVAIYAAITIWLVMILPIFKYLTYGVPLFCLIAVLATRKLTIPPNAYPYLVLFVAGLALAPLAKLKGVQDDWLMLTGFGPFLFGYRYKLSWHVLLAVACITTILTVGVSRFHGGSVDFDAAGSHSPLEAQTSFLFGTLAVWAALERRWGRAVVALLLCIVTLKRIVALGTIVALVLILLPRKLTDRLLRPIPMIIFNGLIIVLVVLYARGVLDQFIIHFTGQAPNQFGMGRQQLYQVPVGALLKEPLQFAFHGLGAGGVYDLLKVDNLFLTGRQNLHNDSLKILVEYGGLAWLAFFTALYWPKQFEVRLMMLFLNVLLLTDNTLIYPFVTFIVTLAVTRLTDARADPTPAVITKSPRTGLNYVRSS